MMVHAPNRPAAVSLFSGAGGMDVGFDRAGFEVVWANDLDEQACRTYERNQRGPIACGPVECHVARLSRFEGIEMVFGGPPCQGFSVAGKMEASDERSDLIWEFFKVVGVVRPKMFVMENVKALATLQKWSAVRSKIFSTCARLGYEYYLVILNASDYGVPQARERMFLYGRRGGISPTKVDEVLRRRRQRPRSVREILSELGRAGSVGNARTCNARITIAENPVLRKSPYAGMLFNGQGRPLNPDGYSSTLHASMGGNKTPIIDERHVFEDGPSWVEDYHAHLMAGGKPLPFDGAPAYLRRLTVDEAIRLQTFPSDYQFVGGQSTVFRQVGNAVPCDLAEVVGAVALELLADSETAVREQSMVPRAEPGTQIRLPV